MTAEEVNFRNSDFKHITRFPNENGITIGWFQEKISLKVTSIPLSKMGLYGGHGEAGPRYCSAVSMVLGLVLSNASARQPKQGQATFQRMAWSIHSFHCSVYP